MLRKVRSRLIPLAAAAALLAISAGTAVAAGSPKASFAFAICGTTVPEIDPDTGEPTGNNLPALELFFSWSGAYVDTLSASWTRTDGGDVFFGAQDTDFAAGTSGSVDFGTFTIQSDIPELDGIAGSFSVKRHTLATRNIAEPSGGWETVAACA